MLAYAVTILSSVLLLVGCGSGGPYTIAWVPHVAFEQEAVEQDIVAAIEGWQEVGEISLELVPYEDGSNPTIKVQFAEVFVWDDWLADDVEARAFTSWSLADFHCIKESTIDFNLESRTPEDWVIGASERPDSGAWFRADVMHEIGHALGIVNHINDVDSVMRHSPRTNVASQLDAQALNDRACN